MQNRCWYWPFRYFVTHFYAAKVSRSRYYALPPSRGGGIKRWCCLTYLCLTSVWRSCLLLCRDPESLQRGRCGEWPNGTRGGSGEGCPLPSGVGSGEGLCPSPEKKMKFSSCIAHFSVFYRKSYALYRMMTFSMTFTDCYPRLQARIDSQPPLLTAVAPAASREFFLWQFYQKDTSMCPKNLTSIMVTISISASWFFWTV